MSSFESKRILNPLPNLCLSCGHIVEHFGKKMLGEVFIHYIQTFLSVDVDECNRTTLQPKLVLIASRRQSLATCTSELAKYTASTFAWDTIFEKYSHYMNKCAVLERKIADFQADIKHSLQIAAGINHISPEELSTFLKSNEYYCAYDQLIDEVIQLTNSAVEHASKMTKMIDVRHAQYTLFFQKVRGNIVDPLVFAKSSDQYLPSDIQKFGPKNPFDLFHASKEYEVYKLCQLNNFICYQGIQMPHAYVNGSGEHFWWNKITHNIPDQIVSGPNRVKCAWNNWGADPEDD